MSAQQTQKQPRTAPKEVRQQQLIDATIDVLAEKSISGTTMADVTGHAGLSMGIVSLHFKSKDNLLTSSLRHLAMELRDAWLVIFRDPTLTVPQKLMGIATASFDPEICSPKKIAVWFAFFGEARYRKVYREMAEEFDDERSDALEELCTALIEEGGYADVSAEDLATTMECLCDGMWLNMILYPEWITPDYAEAQMTNLLVRHFPKHFDAPRHQPKPCGPT